MYRITPLCSPVYRGAIKNSITRWLIVTILALLALAGLAGSPRTPTPYDALRVKAIAFDRPWDRYIRELHGCPLAGETTAQTCHLASGTIDYQAFAQARRAAKEVFAF